MRSINFSLPLIAKNVVAVIFSFLLISTLIISCKKSNLVTEETKQPSFENLIPKIKSWIDGQKNGLSTASAATIESLESNLSYGEIRLEKYKDSKELVVIPILSGFKSANNSDKNPANYLVLVIKNQDSITNGNIVQYVSSSSQKTLPNNTFSKIFTYQEIDCSGLFTVLALTDNFQYELKFENGKLKSMTDLKKRNHSKEGASGRENADCIDWYLQTWLVWADGTMELQSEIYVYTTCDGDCWQPRIANGRSYRINCNGSPSGGGGNDIEYEVEYFCIGDINRTLYVIYAGYGGGKVTVYEKGNAKFHRIDTSKDKFTNFLYQNIAVQNNTAGAQPTITQHQPTGIGTSTLSVATAGTVNYPDNTYLPWSLTETIQLGMVSWGCIH